MFQLEFADEQAVASITLTIKDDQVSELDEVTRVTLVEVTESGTPVPGRGARIGESWLELYARIIRSVGHGQ